MNDNVARDLYISLLMKALTCELWEGLDGSCVMDRGLIRPLLIKAFRRMHLTLVRDVNTAARETGVDWPAKAQTMVGRKRMENIRFCVESVLTDGIPGDLIETGVWRGGSTILMKGLLRAWGVDDRTVWVADSFQGLPPRDVEKYPQDLESPEGTEKWSPLAVSMEQVQKNFERYDLLDDHVRFLKGWFKDTLATAPIGKLAVARLDGDLYESTMDAIVPLYPKLSVGGYLIVDDYNGWPACKKAVDEYREKNGITEEIHKIDWTGVYWRKDR